MAAFRLPNQTNRLALIMDPLTDRVPFTFGIEIFERGHRTTPHTHPTSQELFFILAGLSQALRLLFCFWPAQLRPVLFMSAQHCPSCRHCKFHAPLLPGNRCMSVRSRHWLLV